MPIDHNPELGEGSAGRGTPSVDVELEGGAEAHHGGVEEQLGEGPEQGGLRGREGEPRYDAAVGPERQGPHLVAQGPRELLVFLALEGERVGDDQALRHRQPQRLIPPQLGSLEHLSLRGEQDEGVTLAAQELGVEPPGSLARDMDGRVGGVETPELELEPPAVLGVGGRGVAAAAQLELAVGEDLGQGDPAGRG